MNKFGLIGKSLSHSYSKIIHEYLYKEYNLNYTYELLSVEEDNLKEYINKVRTKEFIGYNITIPYKEKVIEYIDVAHSDSCNTILLIDNKVHGFNTDIEGFAYLLEYYNIKLKDCLILGSGGASKAVQKVLFDKGIKYSIISRSNNGYDNLITTNKDIINTTPIGMYPNISESVLNKEQVVCATSVVDLIYNPKQTLLMSYNNNSYNGIVMLVYQAVKAFEKWTGIEVNDIVINKIIKEVGEFNE